MSRNADDGRYLNALQAAQQVDSTPRVNAALWLILLIVAAALGWASIAEVNEVTRADGRVVAEGRDQVIASLEGGILAELLVREGMTVEPDQPLVRMDATRAEAQHGEGQARRVALQASIARLEAEASGRPLKFPPSLADKRTLLAGESDLYSSRQRGLQDALASTRRSIELVQRELNVAEQMSARGLMSDVEVLRLRRQVNELQLQVDERINRFRQDATAELTRQRSELAQLDEQQVVREDITRRTVLRSTVRGIVKSVRVATIGGVVQAGAPILDIVPLGDRVLVEARIRPSDIGFVRVGQTAEVKLSAYDYTTYGGLKGTIEYLSPDALGDTERSGAADSTYYRALVRTEGPGPQAGGQPLPVTPGMTATVDISTGERSVLSYLLRPMLKSREAFRER